MFGESLNVLVDNFRNTEDTLDKEKRKVKEVVEDDDISRIGGFDDNASRANEGMTVYGDDMKRLGQSGGLSMQSINAIPESSRRSPRRPYLLGVGERHHQILRETKKEELQRQERQGNLTG